MFWNWKWGQNWAAKLGGTQGVQGQTSGQYWKPTMWGVQRTNLERLWTTRVAGKPPPSGGGGTVVQLMQQGCSLQPPLGQCGAQGKNPKNIEMVGLKTWVGVVYRNKFHFLICNTKITLNAWTFAKIWNCALLTFCLNLKVDFIQLWMIKFDEMCYIKLH